MTDPLPESITLPLHMLWLAQTGPGMTAAEIDFVGASKLPLEREWNGGGLRGTSSLARDLFHPVVGPTASTYLLGAGLVCRASSQRLKITEQGIALLKGTMRQSSDNSAVFKLDPEAPLDYIGLMSELDSLAEPIVVDPYFHPHDFAMLADALPGVTLLTIDREVSKVDAFDKPRLNASLKRGQFEGELGRQASASPTCTVIYVPATALHDRYFLGSNRQGYFAGGSFRSSKPTVVMELEPDHAGELYNQYRDIAEGADATPLEPRTVTAAATPTAS